MKKSFVISILSFFLLNAPVYAYDWFVSGAHVTLVEGTYMPNVISFQIDQAAGNCPAGASLTWNGGAQNLGPDNVKANFALLLAAKSSGSPINLYGINAGCVGQYIHSLR